MAKSAKEETKLSIPEFLNWWFNPKNGKVDYKVKVTDKKPTSPTFGKQITVTVRGFHAVNSGCNDLIRKYYGVKDIVAFWDDAKSKKLVTTKPVKGGVMVYPYSASSSDSKVANLMEEMGI